MEKPLGELFYLVGLPNRNDHIGPEQFDDMPRLIRMIGQYDRVEPTVSHHALYTHRVSKCLTVVRRCITI